VFNAGEEAVHVFYGIYEGGPRPLAIGGAGSRLSAAWAGKRTYGQTYLELAVRGPVGARDARAALKAELARGAPKLYIGAQPAPPKTHSLNKMNRIPSAIQPQASCCNRNAHKNSNKRKLRWR
jgi:hypothetical protein